MPPKKRLRTFELIAHKYAVEHAAARVLLCSATEAMRRLETALHTFPRWRELLAEHVNPIELGASMFDDEQHDPQFESVVYHPLDELRVPLKRIFLELVQLVRVRLAQASDHESIAAARAEKRWRADPKPTLHNFITVYYRDECLCLDAWGDAAAATDIALHTTPFEIAPDRWKPYDVFESDCRDKVQVKLANTRDYPCSKCGTFNVYLERVQKRRADEETDVSLECLDCHHRWFG